MRALAGAAAVVCALALPTAALAEHTARTYEDCFSYSWGYASLTWTAGSEPASGTAVLEKFDGSDWQLEGDALEPTLSTGTIDTSFGYSGTGSFRVRFTLTDDHESGTVSDDVACEPFTIEPPPPEGTLVELSDYDRALLQQIIDNTAADEPSEEATTVALSSYDREQASLAWVGVWMLGGLIFGLAFVRYLWAIVGPWFGPGRSRTL